MVIYYQYIATITMNILFFDLFTGVGFCNQLFSLETAFYMAYKSQCKKLVIIAKNPLCHCGVSNWKYGNFTDLLNLNNYIDKIYNNLPFSDKLSRFSFEIYYKKLPDNILKLYNESTHINYSDKFSRLCFVNDTINLQTLSQYETDALNKFAGNRTITHINLTYSDSDDLNYKITQSNASRLFYNFYLFPSDIQDKKVMNNIGNMCQEINQELTNIYNKLINNVSILKNKFIAIHFRFGDERHLSTNKLNNQQTNNGIIMDIFKLIDEITGLPIIDSEISAQSISPTSIKKQIPIIIMCDRKDSFVLDELHKRYTNIYFTQDIISQYIEEQSTDLKDRVNNFLLQKKICEQSYWFIATEGSTVSTHINYVRYSTKNIPLINCTKYYNAQNLKVENNFHNAMRMFQEFARLGIRQRSNDIWPTELIKYPINVTHILDQLRQIRSSSSRSMSDYEKLLIGAKIPYIVDICKKQPTLVITEFITGIVEPLRKALENAGLKIGIYTGTNKYPTYGGFENSLEEFKGGATDVLIGSGDCLGTGIDGLQDICNHMIYATLPWTEGDNAQIQARLARERQIHEVFIHFSLNFCIHVYVVKKEV